MLRRFLTACLRYISETHTLDWNSRLISTAFGTQLIKSWVGTPNFGG